MRIANRIIKKITFLNNRRISEKRTNTFLSDNSREDALAFSSYRPDFQTYLHRIKDYKKLFNTWTVNSPANEAGDMVRFYFLFLQLEDLAKRNVEGDIAELGVFMGTTAKLFKQMLPGKKIHLFDTFEGFSERDLDAEKEYSDAVEHAFATSIENVKAFVGEEETYYYQGYFPDTAEKLEDDIKFCLIHLDADLYKPQLEGMKFFYDKINPGGLLIIHDCNNGFSGSRKALDEFFADKPEIPIFIPDKSGTSVIIKI